MEAADGTVYLDFAGGIACQNTGHGFAPVVAAIHEQVDRFLHQCFMVGTYEPYVEVCRRLAEHSPCAGVGAEVDPRQQRRRGDRERGQDRARGDRPAGRRRLRERLPRPHAPDDGDDEQGAAVQGRLRAVPRRDLPRGGAVSRTAASTSDAAIASLEHLFKSEVDAESVACVVLETVQGEGGFIPMPADYLAATRGAVRAPRDPLRRRRGAVGRGADRADVGDRALRGRPAGSRSSPGKSLGGGLPLAAVTGRAEVMDAPGPGGLGGHVRRQPRRVRRGGASCSTRSRSPRSAPARTSSACALRSRLDELAARHEQIGEVRGLGPMLALELREQSPDLRPGRDGRRLRAGPAPARVRSLRQRAPAAAAAHRHGRGARPRACAPRGVACRRRLRSTFASPGCASGTAT